MVEWIIFPSGKKICRCHYKQICPSYPKADTHNPSFPVEKVKERKKSDENKITSKQRATTSKQRRVIVERFHSYMVKFNAVVDWDSLKDFPEFSLRNNVKYKRIDFDKAIVKVFRRSILVVLRASCNIKGLPVREAKLLSDSIVREVLYRLPNSIIVKGGDSVINGHNAFMEHPYAKRNVSVSINGENRFVSDNSLGVCEFEAVNPKFFVSDSEALEQDIVSLVDKGLSRDYLAHCIDVLIKDREYYAENLKAHVLAIRELSFLVKRALRIRNKGVESNSCFDNK